MSKRLERYRQTAAMRRFVAETEVGINDLIMPIFINESLSDKRPIESLPGIFQQSLSSLESEVKRIVELGISAVILFGIPEKKDANASEADNKTGIIQESIRKIKSIAPDLLVIADCCLCEYTDHGHCHVLEENGQVRHEATLKRLQDIAQSYAEAGVDIIAPSGMVDTMVQHLRTALDNAGYPLVPIMSYAVKYASQFYGPFRDAAGSKDVFQGTRDHHQLQSAQVAEALAEACEDIKEGSDFLLVKPAMPYLDIIQRLKSIHNIPIVAYQVSGEYAMLKASAKANIIDEIPAVMESLIAIKRAGASQIITYYAKEIAEFLNRT